MNNLSDVLIAKPNRVHQPKNIVRELSTDDVFARMGPPNKRIRRDGGLVGVDNCKPGAIWFDEVVKRNGRFIRRGCAVASFTKNQIEFRAVARHLMSGPMYLVSRVGFVIESDQTCSSTAHVTATFTRSIFGDALIFKLKHCRQPNDQLTDGGPR